MKHPFPTGAAVVAIAYGLTACTTAYNPQRAASDAKGTTAPRVGSDRVGGTGTRLGSDITAAARAADSNGDVSKPTMAHRGDDNGTLAGQLAEARQGYLAIGLTLAEADKRIVAQTIATARATGNAALLDALEVDRPDLMKQGATVPGPGRSTEGVVHIQAARQAIMHEAHTRQNQAAVAEERRTKEEVLKLDYDLTRTIVDGKATSDPNFRSNLDALMKLDPDKARSVIQYLQTFRGLRGSPEALNGLANRVKAGTENDP